MHILLIAPNAPPQNSAESIQVGRYVSELVKRHEVTLATSPIERGWIRADEGLALRSDRLRIITLRLPMHQWVTRVLHSRWLSAYSWPDQYRWILWRMRSLIPLLDPTPDLIYSRSYPLSASLLAMRLSRTLGLPWIMHLSDPWADSPYRKLPPRWITKDHATESECFESASFVTLTTKTQLEFYIHKYPRLASKFAVTGNVAAQTIPVHRGPRRPGPLRIVYTGALYGGRRLTGLLQAIQKLRKQRPELEGKFKVSIVGNVTQDILAEARSVALPMVEFVGPVDFQSAIEFQQDADILVSIEPDGEHPLIGYFSYRSCLIMQSAGNRSSPSLQKEARPGPGVAVVMVGRSRRATCPALVSFWLMPSIS